MIPSEGFFQLVQCLLFFLLPFPRGVLSGQQAQRGRDCGIVWYESGDVLCHTKKRLQFTMVPRRLCLVDCFNFLWIRSNTDRAENVTIELDFSFGKRTLVFVETEVIFFKPLENTTEILVVFFLVFSKYYDVI